MSVTVTMPALSPTMEEGTLAKWRVKEGDEVKAGDVLAEIETDKATMEVEAVDEGTVGKLLVPEGTEGVKVNAVIAMLLEEGESADDLDVPATGEAPALSKPAAAKRAPAEAAETGHPDAVLANPSARRLAEEAGIDLSAVKGSGPHGRITKGDVAAAAEKRGASEPAAPRQSPASGRVFASPLARRMASEKGYELAQIAGSGPNGRVVRADVEAFVPPAAAPGKAAPPVTGDAPFEEVRLSTMRKTIARRMTEAKQTVPHFYLTVEVEIDKLLDIRQDLNEVAGDGPKLSVNDFIIRAAALALMQFPDANVQYAGDTLRRYARADVSVAVAIDGGLITPIVKGAEQKTVAQISAEMKELAGRARKGKLAPEEYQGGTISISNLGMFGIKEFMAVINPPQASILAVGAGERRPVVRGDRIEAATVMSVTMACDHRAIDGAIGAQYLQVFKSLLEHPARLLV